MITVFCHRVIRAYLSDIAVYGAYQLGPLEHWDR
jgi:hypothetical protein